MVNINKIFISMFHTGTLKVIAGTLCFHIFALKFGNYNFVCAYEIFHSSAIIDFTIVNHFPGTNGC
jgi:hypothetical protein